MINAKGNEQSECFKCKSEGKFSLTWTSFLYYVENDKEHLYCFKHASEIEKENNK